MNRPRIVCALTITAVLASSYSLRADVRSDQKSRVEFAGMLGRMFNMFGGKSAREGTTSTVAVKGNRKATLNDSTGQIIDLAEEKVYDLDLKKKTYKVTTFAELRRQMEEAKKKAEEEARKEQAKETKEPAKPTAPPEKEVEVDFSVKNTGEKKTINGFETHQAIMTIALREKGKTLEQGGGMVLTSDMWLTPSIPAMKEVGEFDMKYAQKLYGPVMGGVSADQMAAAMAMYPMMKDAIARMNVEGGKIEGTPILSTTTMDAVKSEAQLAEEAKQKETSTASDSSKTPTSVGGLLGGFGKKMAAKKMAGGDEAAKPRATIMTTTNEVLKVVTDVSAADVAVPAGFKENK